MKTLHSSETSEDIKPSTNDHISEDLSSQYMTILAQNSLHSAQRFCYVLQYPKASICITCPWTVLQIWVCWRMGAYAFSSGSMSTNLDERMGTAWTTLLLTPFNSVKTSLFRDVAPVDTTVNYSATIFVFNILSNLLFTVLQSCHAVYSKSLTLSINKPRRSDVHIVQGS
jgi:hypothetical protein